ncbi:Mss4-like protein [Tirmania nivea]|nr:Mss4-like protein [Tirmania nivea]
MTSSPLTKSISGGCFCGRIKFTITPKPLTEEPDPAYGPPPHLFYCNCSQCRRQHASPLVPVIRLPLAWTSYTMHPMSATETSESILKVYNSTPGVVERRFCGFCGTSMSYWSSASDEEKATLYIPIGALSDESQNILMEQVGKPELHFYWDSGAGWFQKLLAGSEVVKGGKFRSGVESEMIQE